MLSSSAADSQDSANNTQKQKSKQARRRLISNQVDCTNLLCILPMGKIWQDDTVRLLIQTIRKYEPIWNTKHPRYTQNKRTRRDSWKEISSLFNKRCSKFQLKPEEVCSKWNNLRLSFQKESKRISDLGLKSSRWKYFEMLTFLKDHQKNDTSLSVPNEHFLRQQETRLKLENIDETGQVGCMSPGGFQTHCGRKSPGFGINTIIPSDVLGRTNMESTFGDYVSAEIRHLELDLQIKAKKMIFDVLINMQYEQQSRSRSRSSQV